MTHRTLTDAEMDEIKLLCDKWLDNADFNALSTSPDADLTLQFISVIQTATS